MTVTIRKAAPAEMMHAGRAHEPHGNGVAQDHTIGLVACQAASPAARLVAQPPYGRDTADEAGKDLAVAAVIRPYPLKQVPHRPANPDLAFRRDGCLCARRTETFRPAMSQGTTGRSNL
ncbi:MAG: hypothetical protein P4L71_06750 [Acetobacteraceae bacterium]|nr:hypothetical protein [Acetobacteraceae bacterium]